MISYNEAVRKILANIRTMEAEERPLLDALGMVTAADVHAGSGLPRWDISGPDGYAVRSEDIKGAGRKNPAVLKVIETVRAGSLPRKTVTPGTAARIMTGSVVPEGADCVVRFEDTDEPEGKNGPREKSPVTARIFVPVPPGGSILKAGSNMKKGALVLARGSVIGPAQLSTLIACGIERVAVVRRPVIAMIATGDELMPIGNPIRPGKVYNSNAATVASLITHFGGVPKVLGIARDTEASITGKLQKGSTVDAIVTSGGVAMGDYDLVRRTLGKMGHILFEGVRMGPGAGTVFGTINRQNGAATALPVFALSGPPSGCLINFETLVRPAILKMRGIKETRHRSVRATALDSSPIKRGIDFIRWTRLTGADGQYQVELNLLEKFGGYRAMAEANSFTIIPKDAVIEAGDEMEVLPLSWRDNY